MKSPSRTIAARRTAVQLADAMLAMASLQLDKDDVDEAIKLAESKLAELRRRRLVIDEKIEKATKEVDELSNDLAEHTTTAARQNR